MNSINIQTPAARLARIIFFGLLAYVPLHIFVSTWVGTSFNILDFSKAVKDVILIVGFGFALVASWQKPFFKKLLHDKLVWLILAFAGLNLGLALVKPTDQDAEILGLVYNTRFLVFFLYGALLTGLYKPKKLIKDAVKVVLTSALIVVVFGLAQYLFLPSDALEHLGYQRANGVLPAFFIDDKPDLERIMATVRDPNSLGSYLVIILALILVLILELKAKAKKRVLWLLAGFTVLALVWTFSRSAWLGALAAVGTIFGLYAFKQYKPTSKRLKSIVTIATTLIVVFSGVLFLFKDSYLVQNVIFHADSSTVLEDPNQLRVRFWRESVSDITAEPLGSGPGTAGPASIKNDIQGTILNENYYLQTAQELGIIGLGLFLGVLGVVFRRLWVIAKSNKTAVALLASFVGLALTNFLVHIWANEAVAYTWWGLAGLLALTSKKKSTSQQDYL